MVWFNHRLESTPELFSSLTDSVTLSNLHMGPSGTVCGHLGTNKSTLVTERVSEAEQK